MNGSKSKALRRFINPAEGDQISKKVYRRAKKEFSKLNEQQKNEFINNLNIVKNSK